MVIGDELDGNTGEKKLVKEYNWNNKFKRNLQKECGAKFGIADWFEVCEEDEGAGKFIWNGFREN